MKRLIFTFIYVISAFAFTETTYAACNNNPESIFYCGQGVSSSANRNYATDVIWIDERRGAVNAFNECMSNDICYGLVTVAAAYVGIPPQAVAAAKLISTVTTNRNGESTSFFVHPPNGYDICTVKIKTNSVVPSSGNSASQMSIGVYPWEAGIMTTTPRQKWGAGSSWNGWFVFTFVKQGVDHRGKCRISGNRTIFRCKGSVGNGGTCGEHDL